MNRFLSYMLYIILLTNPLDVRGQDKRGDVNGDGVVNAADIVVVVNEIFGQSGGGQQDWPTIYRQEIRRL